MEFLLLIGMRCVEMKTREGGLEHRMCAQMEQLHVVKGYSEDRRHSLRVKTLITTDNSMIHSLEIKSGRLTLVSEHIVCCVEDE